MDILAAMLAYLGCVGGVIGALVISFMVYFSPPSDQTILVKQSAATAQQIMSKASASRQASTDAQQPDRVATTLAQNVTPPKPGASSPAQVQAMRAQYVRRLAQEGRARRWAYQQDPSFENRFLGYAD
jgi:hypothetical protein